MSNPIILRFYCKEHGYIESGFGTQITEVYFNQRGELGLPCPKCHKSRPMTIEQAIGRDDATGIRIFEGDIVKTQNHDLPGAIEWTDDLCQWSVVTRVYDGGPDDYWLDGDFIDPDKPLEVVGNIHQNEGLLG